jgi:hypothetical protein
MRIDKGNRTLNYIFGAFIVLSAIKVSSDLYQRYRQAKRPLKRCGCGKKE